MSDFTDKDRHMLIETHTLVKIQSQKISDIETKVDTHEALKNRLMGWCLAVSAGVGGAVAYVSKSFAGIFK